MKSLSGAAWLAQPETQAVFRALKDFGYEARAVGGAVRNSLLGRPVSDIDIATTAHPDAIIAASKAAGLAAVATGIDHGTVTVISNHIPHEVTTLREDVSTDGRRATVAFTTDWARDAARRDFTINALYCGADGTIFDPLGGLADLAVPRVRFIGSPDDRIREDFLRILRFFRFSAVYASDELDADGLAACDRERRGLRQLSAERVSAEMLKLLQAERMVPVLGVMHRHGYLADILGAAPSIGRLQRLCTLEAVNALPTNSVIRLAALAVHTDEGARALGKRLRLSRADTQRLQIAARGLASKFEFVKPEAALRRSLYFRGPESYRLSRLFGWLASNVHPTDANAKASLELPARWSPPTLPLSGADVLALGVPSGPDIGRLIEDLELWWIEQDFLPDRDACLQKLRHLALAS